MSAKKYRESTPEFKKQAFELLNRGENGHFRVHRGFVQSPTLAFHFGLL